MRIVFILFFSVFLAACSPDYNWREVRLGNGAVTALFPDRPITHERTLHFSGHEIQFALTSASVKKALFAVGVAPLPPALVADPAAAHELATSVIKSLYQKLGAPPPTPLPGLGETFTIHGNASGATMRLQVQVWLTKYALVEAAVTADGSVSPENEAAEFMRGLVLAR